MAEAILKKDREAEEARTRKFQKERDVKERAILDAFKAAFYEYIPLLEQELIIISAHYKSAYEHYGSYIEFQKGSYILKMDFNNCMSYRYEYTKPDQHGSMVLSDWPKERFVIFIYNWLEGIRIKEDCPVI
jgi:hypothetical protein